MARPRKQEGVPTGREAIEASFWELYREKPFEKISVKEVCEKAHVNKTTFYYHFQDLHEVLDSIENDCLPLEAPLMVTALIKASDKEQVVASFIDSMGERFDRYCLLLSSKGDPSFAKRAKHVMALRWCETLGVDYETLPPDLRMATQYVMGGTTSIFADHGEGEPFDPKVFADVMLSMVIPLIDRATRCGGGMGVILSNDCLLKECAN